MEEHEEAQISFTLSFSTLPPAAGVRSPGRTPTSPLKTLASVPFRWEEQPGKPRVHCAGDVPAAKYLELPPCRRRPMMPSSGGHHSQHNFMARPKSSSFRFWAPAVQDSTDSSSTSSSGARDAPETDSTAEAPWRSGNNMKEKLTRKGSFLSIPLQFSPKNLWADVRSAIPWVGKKKSNKESIAAKVPYKKWDM